MATLTDALGNADREIDLAEAALAEAKWLMIWFERADDEVRPELRRKLLRELDSAVRVATAARKHVELTGRGRTIDREIAHSLFGHWYVGSNLILGALGGSALGGEFGSAGVFVGALVGAAFGLWLASKGRTRQGRP